MTRSPSTRLIGDKIRVEQDWTEDGIATALARAGVPWEDMSFGFHEPALTAPENDAPHPPGNPSAIQEQGELRQG